MHQPTIAALQDCILTSMNSSTEAEALFEDMTAMRQSESCASFSSGGSARLSVASLCLSFPAILLDSLDFLSSFDSTYSSPCLVGLEDALIGTRRSAKRRLERRSTNTPPKPGDTWRADERGRPGARMRPARKEITASSHAPPRESRRETSPFHRLMS